MRDRWTTLGTLARISASGVLAILFFSAGALAQLGATVPNWAPPSVNPASAVQSGMHLMTVSNDVTNPIVFVGVTPCRIVDTRQAAGPFGGPHISPGSPRSFNIPAGPCPGIPSTFNSQAYSLNITATNTTATGFVKVFPEGESSPVVSTLNFVAGVTIANAAVVAAGTSGGITVAASATTDILIDINGYYTDTPDNQNNYFRLYNNSGSYTMYLVNNSTTCTSICGLFVEADGGYAIEGKAHGATGLTFGVYGESDSTAAGSAGVLGVDDTGIARTGGVTAGVRGESVDFLGVVGISQSGSYGGVDGILVDSTGATLQEGRLGGGVYGVYSFGDIGAAGTKFFVEPHPTDASKVIRYVSLEGRESGTYFRGSSQFVNGQAVIEVPEDFRMVTDSEGLTVQVTPVGQLATVAVISEDLNQIIVQADHDVKFHYMVNGVRKAFKNLQPITDGQEYMPQSASEKMPVYLTDEAKSRLISNGTYNADGTVNMATAERLGWTKVWADRIAAIQAAAAKAQAAPRTGPSGQ